MKSNCGLERKYDILENSYKERVSKARRKSGENILVKLRAHPSDEKRSEKWDIFEDIVKGW